MTTPFDYGHEALLGLIVVMCTTATVFAVCLTLIFHEQYEDGVIGRLGLALIGTASFARDLSIIDGLLANWYIHISRMECMLWMGLSIFLVRHMYRFLQGKKGNGENWHKADPHRTGGKQ